MEWGLLTEFLNNIAGHLSADVFEKFLGTLAQKAGEQVTGQDLKHLRYKFLKNLPLEDENLFLRAKAELDAEEPNIIIAHGKKLALLQSHQQDYYRLTIVGYPDPKKDKDDDDKFRIAEIKKVVRLHAQMTDDQWHREVAMMNYNQDKAEALSKRLINFIGTDLANGAKATYAALKTIGIDGYNAGKTILGDAWAKVLWPGLKGAGKGIKVAAITVDGELTKAVNAAELHRAALEARARAHNQRRESRSWLRRFLGR